MAAPRLLPDKTELERLRRNGATYGDIAEMYGVTETAVYLRLKADGLIKESRASHSALIPWQVKRDHQHAYPALMLRVLSRRQQGLENSDQRNRMLDSWLETIKRENVVVCYDPDMWANPASKHGGWFYARRKASDGDSLIRYTKPGKGLPRKPKGA